ncbi:MAG: CinA family protein [Chloroflexi bacterium]|nr:MAG: CinA family protein [Chloroflexota bacterium]MBL1194660.1 CinA family protein [Chloroflexota bacterium]NOH11950.1 CinA family protein [Chloroflexota bacterium]
MSDPLEVSLGPILRERELTVAFAESCTGGLVGHRMTNVPGSSDYYWGSVTAYAYEAKAALLSVSWDTLNSHGAVSSETVKEMAEGIRKNMGSDIGISISGIAGPGGGTDEKPVGLVWFGLSAPDGTWSRHFIFDGERTEVKAQAAESALNYLREYLAGML